MGFDSVVLRHTISIGNSNPRFGVKASVCDYLGLNEWIPINGIR